MQLSVTMLQHVLSMHDAPDSTTVHRDRRIKMEKGRSQRTTGLQRPMSEQAESKSGRKARWPLSLEACKTSKSTFLLILLIVAPSLQVEDSWLVAGAVRRQWSNSKGRAW